MKKYITLFSLLVCFSITARAQQPVDSVSVIQNYFKAHGWAVLYDVVQKAEAQQAAKVEPTPIVGERIEIIPVDPLAGMANTTIEWKESTFDFGKITQSDSVSHQYYFKNTGTNPAKVGDVKPACGCTKGKFSSELVPPGGEGYVELKFSPHGKQGLLTKTATVTINTEVRAHQLSFTVDVAPPPAPPEQH